jgi:hypothetical protein
VGGGGGPQEEDCDDGERGKEQTPVKTV